MARVRTKGRAQLHVVLSDFHVPFHDEAALALVLDFLARERPHTVHLLGDIIDFYPVSAHQTSPERVNELQADLDKCVTILTQIRSAVGEDCKIRLSEGNHENRLTRYLRGNSPELTSLRTLTVPALLQLRTLGISYYDATHPYKIGPLTYTHGTIVRQHSAYTARAMLLKVGGSVIHGHTHRLGAHHTTDWHSDHAAWENGCLCRCDPNLGNEYIIGRPNWQLGFSLVWYANRTTRDRRFSVQQIRFIKGKSYVYDGHLYEYEGPA